LIFESPEVMMVSCSYKTSLTASGIGAVPPSRVTVAFPTIATTSATGRGVGEGSEAVVARALPSAQTFIQLPSVIAIAKSHIFTEPFIDGSMYRLS
jgi:hypothetical protein